MTENSCPCVICYISPLYSRCSTIFRDLGLLWLATSCAGVCVCMCACACVCVCVDYVIYSSADAHCWQFWLYLNYFRHRTQISLAQNHLVELRLISLSSIRWWSLFSVTWNSCSFAIFSHSIPGKPPSNPLHSAGRLDCSHNVSIHTVDWAYSMWATVRMGTIDQHTPPM